jgi:hypothetical protein
MSAAIRRHHSRGLRTSALIASFFVLALSACTSIPSAQHAQVDQGTSHSSVMSRASKANPTPILWPTPFVNLGLVLRDLSQEELKRLRLPYGVLVEAVGDDAEFAGLRAGDVIVAVNQFSVPTLQKFWETVEAAEQRVFIVVIRGDEVLRFELFNLDI